MTDSSLSERDLAALAIERLSEAGFMTTLSRAQVGNGRERFVMAWRKRGSQWWTEGDDLATVGRNACAWFDVRRTGEGNEESFAHRGALTP